MCMRKRLLNKWIGNGKKISKFCGAVRVWESEKLVLCPFVDSCKLKTDEWTVKHRRSVKVGGHSSWDNSCNELG